MRKPSLTQLKRKADKLFSQIVRRKGFCERCLRSSNLQCAHIVSRTNKNLRWNLDNAVCLCYRCHFHWAHRNPLEFTEWVRTNFPIQYAFLMREKNKPDLNVRQTIQFTIKKLEEQLLEYGGATES